nr:HAMP domain-containing sensor histidine kinase [uncultured Carboxylicivirga sp.]
MIQYNKKENKRLKKQLIILTLLSVFFTVVIGSSSYSRIVIMISMAAFFLYMFYFLVIKKGNSKMQHVIGWIALLFVLVNTSRDVFSFIYGNEWQIYKDITIQLLAGLIWIVVAYTFPLLFLFILIENDNYKLKELNLTKDKFFKIIGHDLKGPIGQMIQLSELMEETYKELKDEKLLLFARSMKESSIRGFKLLENLLTWASSQTGSLSFSPSLINVSELIDENVELLRKQADVKNIHIKLMNIYEGQICIDRNMISGVLRNLLSNAIKFTPVNGELKVFTTIEKGYLIVSVQDSGIGMSKDNYRKLFKLDSTFTTLGTNNEKGTGIGLILCKEFVDRHKGEIWVESELNVGSIFNFKIPLVNADESQKCVKYDD